MGSFIIYCQYCNAKLDVDDSYLGQELQCPVCHRLIRIKNDDFPDAPEVAEKPDAPVINPMQSAQESANSSCRSTAKAPTAGRWHRYFWGMLGVSSAKFIAALLILSGIYFSWDLFRRYHYDIALMPEKLQLDAASRELLRQEKELNAELLNTVTLLNGGGVIRDGVLDGMVLSGDAARRPLPMPVNIDSESAVAEAKAVVAQYTATTESIKKAFIQNFGRLLDYIAPELKNTQLDSRNGNIVVTTGGSQRKFYVAETVKLQELETLLRMLEQLQKKSAGNAEVARRLNRNGLDRSLAAAKFVERRLFSQAANTTVVRTSRRNDQTQMPVSSRDQLTDDVLDVYSVINELSRDWKLDLQLSQMQSLLKRIAGYCEIYERKRTFMRHELVRSLIGLWLEVLAASFALMIAADFLRAHFETAELLHKKYDEI